MIDALRKVEKESIEGKTGSIRVKRSILNFLFAGKQRYILKRHKKSSAVIEKWKEFEIEF